MNKYHAKPTGGHASKAEHRRACELKLLERAGKISDLKEQVRFELVPKRDGERAVVYVADFTYTEKGTFVVEDCKGFKTPVYRLKKRLMAHVHGIKIRETS